MSIVYETIGFSGSGKSTFAREFIKDKPNVKIVSPDGFRLMFNGEYKYLPEMDNVISQCAFHVASLLLWKGYDVIIDCGNLQRSADRRGLWAKLNADKFIAFVMPMDKPIEWYVKRRMLNPHYDDCNFHEKALLQINQEKILKDEMKAYEPPTFEEFDEIWEIMQNENKEICEILPIHCTRKDSE